jgi:hypothetical protein
VNVSSSATAVTLPRAGVAAGDVGELAFKSRGDRPAVGPFQLGRGCGERGVKCLRCTVYDEACPGERLERRTDRTIRIEIMRPRETAAQRQDCILHREGFISADTEFATIAKTHIGESGSWRGIHELFATKIPSSSICNPLEPAERAAFAAVFLLVASVNVQTEWQLLEYVSVLRAGNAKDHRFCFCFLIL